MLMLPRKARRPSLLAGVAESVGRHGATEFVIGSVLQLTKSARRIELYLRGFV